MFRKKKDNPFIKMFENQNSKDEKNNCFETLSLKEKINTFFKLFKYQSGEFKIVWIIRIFCWVIIIAVTLFGAVIKIKNKF